MRVPKALRTSVFQLALMYIALFSVSVSALFLFVYWATIGYLGRQTDAVIEAEINGLVEQADRRGLIGLVDVISERVGRDSEQRSVYLLADAIGRGLAGNMPYWPRELEAVDDWVDFIRLDEAGVQTPVRARALRIGPGLRLLVGRDVRELAEINAMFRRAAFYGLTLTIGLGLAGGILMGLSAQRRIAQLNRTTRQIVAGDFSQRASITGSQDEHDELAANIN